MLEANNNDGDIVRGMMREGVLQQLRAGVLCIRNFTYKVDSALVISNIPKLTSCESVRSRREGSDIPHRKPILKIRPRRKVLSL